MKLITRIALVGFAAALLLTGSAVAATDMRCGYFINPTPGNAWLRDGEGQWIVGTQGGHQAEGDWPGFSPSQWVEQNGSYGYGCACMAVTVDHSTMEILRIHTAKARPLSACSRDPALKDFTPD